MDKYTTRERFQAVMQNGDLSKGLPVIEWAGWWNLTYENWIRQGAPENTNLRDWFGLDKHHQIWFGPRGSGDTKVANEKDYDRVISNLYPTPKFDPAIMEHRHPVRPRPPVLLDCPWCGSPVELGERDELACGACLVSVELARSRPSGRRLRRAA